MFTGSFDVNLMRPWLSKEGPGAAAMVTVDGKNIPHDPHTSPVNRVVFTREQWTEVDAAVDRGFKQSIDFAAVALEANTFGMPNIMSKCALETESLHKPGSQGESSHFEISALPLPITHADVELGMRGPGLVLDTAKFEGAARMVGEVVEGVLLGKMVTPFCGNCQLYGVLTFPKRKVVDNRTTCEQMVKFAAESKYYGPFAYLYPARLDEKDKPKSYAEAQEALSTKGISHVVPCGQLTTEVALVQLTPDVLRMVVGLNVVAVQWQDKFKVMCIVVPQFRADFHGNTGVVVKNLASLSMDGI